MSNVMTIERMTERLEECASNLLSLNSSTENDFLTIGAHLRDISSRAGGISAMARSAAGLIRSGELEEDMDALQELFDQMDLYLKSSEGKLTRSTGTLTAILKEVDKARTPLAGFRRIVKHLRMLSVSTKIESARLATGETGFGAIADDVEKLSGLIDSKSTGILQTINSLHDAIAETLSKVGDLETWKQGHARTMVNDMVAGLSSLSGKHALSSTTADTVARVSDEIGAHIGGIVSSLQFHDITRQQIEHAIEAVREMCSTVSTLRAAEDPVPGMRDLCLREVCDLQARQLSNAKRELMGAVGKTIEGLRNIAQSAAAISRETAELVGMSGKDDASFLVRLKTDVVKIISSLKENGEANHELSTAIRRVTRTIDELSAFVGDIEEVGTEIELIALNARVTAAKTGVEGAALGVLAEGVRNLSDTSRDQTRTVSDTLARVTNIAKSLGDDLIDPENQSGCKAGEEHAPEEDAGTSLPADGTIPARIDGITADPTSSAGPFGEHDEEGEDRAASLAGEPMQVPVTAQTPVVAAPIVETMVDRLNELLLSFGEVDRRIAAAIDGMEKAGRDLAAEIDDLAQGVTAHETTERVLKKVISEIEGVARQAGEFGPSTRSPGEKAAYLKRFEDRYTMHRERSVHRSSIRSGEPVPSHENDEALGDNVELF